MTEDVADEAAREVANHDLELAKQLRWRGAIIGSMLGVTALPIITILRGEPWQPLAYYVMVTVVGALVGGRLLRILGPLSQSATTGERWTATLALATLLTFAIHWETAQDVYLALSLGLLAGYTAGAFWLHFFLAKYHRWSGREPHRPHFGPPPGHPEAEVRPMD